ncbi:pectinesterase family protein [Isoptericola sp. BMS4]|uniref:pectinesterase family protein n=1 Tax=Isoptericola sp. BMS4 TaxID=2527875 RepID=UPI0014200ECB|nr:pectinesterase family protein [Isoptericola sp. BMS4]
MPTLHVGDDADLLPGLSEALADPDVTEVVLHPGEYVGQVVVAPRAAPLLVRSSTGDPRDVVLTHDLRQGDADPTGMPLVQRCATVTVDADDVTLRGLTIRNTFDKGANPGLPDSQAIALRTRGTRVRVEDCHLLGQQDTLMLDTPSWSSVSHVHLRDCLVVGDVDFVYGRATALVEGGEVRSVGPGYVAAPSTPVENPRGLCFHRVALTAGDGVPDGGVRLARPWHVGGRPDAVGQAMFVACEVGPHVAADRWDDMGGYSWRDDARFAEAGSRLAPGAAEASPGHDLPLADATDAGPAPADVVAAHLAGWDGPPHTDGRLHVLADRTAGGPTGGPRRGWAAALAGTTGRDVVAHPAGGSLAAWVASGGLLTALAAVRPGDVVLLGSGDDAPTDPPDPYREVPALLRRAVVGVRARGATPVLLTPVSGRRFAGGRARATHRPLAQAVRDVARADDVRLLDVAHRTLGLWQAQGEAGSLRSSADDGTLSRSGAAAVAREVAAGLDDLGIACATAAAREVVA